MWRAVHMLMHAACSSSHHHLQSLHHLLCVHPAASSSSSSSSSSQRSTTDQSRRSNAVNRVIESSVNVNRVNRQRTSPPDGLSPHCSLAVAPGTAYYFSSTSMNISTVLLLSSSRYSCVHMYYSNMVLRIYNLRPYPPDQEDSRAPARG